MTDQTAAQETPERYLWKIDGAQSARISSLLDIDFDSLDIGGTWVTRPQLKCHGCGKLSGLDDFIADAFEQGIHSKGFVISVLKGDGPGVQASPPHRLRCLNCKTYYLEPKQTSSELDKTSHDGILLRLDESEGGLALAGWATGTGFQWVHPKSKGEPALMGWATGSGFDWVLKKDESEKEREPALMGWATGSGFDWVLKKDENEKEREPALMGWATGSGFDWVLKKDENEKGREPASVAWATGSGNGLSWALKKDETQNKPAVMGWATGSGFDWVLKKDEPEKEREPALMGWATGSGFDWVLSKSESESHSR